MKEIKCPHCGQRESLDTYWDDFCEWDCPNCGSDVDIDSNLINKKEE